jgi:hypothetical protein
VSGLNPGENFCFPEKKRGGSLGFEPLFVGKVKVNWRGTPVLLLRKLIFHGSDTEDITSITN